MSDGPKIYRTLERKVNLGNFQHMTVTIGVSQLPFDANSEMIDQMLETSTNVGFCIEEMMREEIARIRQEPGRKISAFETEITTKTNGTRPSDSTNPDRGDQPANDDGRQPSISSPGEVVPLADLGTAEATVARAAPSSSEIAHEDDVVLQVPSALEELPRDEDVEIQAEPEAPAETTTVAPVPFPVTKYIPPSASNGDYDPFAENAPALEIPTESAELRYVRYGCGAHGSLATRFGERHIFNLDCAQCQQQPQFVIANGVEAPVVATPSPSIAEDPHSDTCAVAEAGVATIEDIDDDTLARAEEVNLCGSIYGIEIPMPPPSWWEEQITNRQTATDDSAGQVTAINTVVNVELGLHKQRHRTVNLLINEYLHSLGEEDRATVNSLNELSKAEAHIVLTWIDLSGGNTEARRRLYEEIYREHPNLLAMHPQYNIHGDSVERPVTELELQLQASIDAERAKKAETHGPVQDRSVLRIIDEDAPVEIEVTENAVVVPAPEAKPPLAMVVDGGEAEIKFSPSQQRAIDVCLEAMKPGQGPRFIFVTGDAGTGKSTVLRKLKEMRQIPVIAPIGLAALNVGGQTVHSFFGFPIGPLTKGRVKSRTEKIDAIRRAHAIALDEVSMNRVDIMDGIDVCLRKTLGNELPFGGKTIIAFGDLAQLEPVVAGAAEKKFIGENYVSPFFFDADVFTGLGKGQLELSDGKKVEIEMIKLTDIFRQAGNPDFIDALNLIREGDARGLEYINQRVGILPPIDPPPVSLTFTNDAAEVTNAVRLADLDTETRTFRAIITGEIRDREEKPVPEVLELKIGAQVMVAKNFEGNWGRLVNGDIGTVTGFADTVRTEYDEQDVPFTVIEREGPPIVTLRDGRVETISIAEWKKIDYTADEKDKTKLSEKVKGSYQQIPLKLAWAITVHKSQGQTLEAAYIDVDKKAFCHGQTYVALSRVRSFESLYLRRRLTAEDLKIHPRVREFTIAQRRGQFKKEAI